jgi:undecaprenyl-diphosphatase
MNAIDQQLFLWLNALRAPWLDPAMSWITARESWYPLYGLIIVLLLWKYRLRGLWMVLFIFAAVGLSDFWASGICKDLFKQLRPCHEPALQGMAQLLPAGCGGKYGFMSSHAANTFALAMSLWLLLKRQYAWIGLFFIWAAVVAYSRIYAGVHYPGDIIAGAGSGALIAWGLYKAALRWTRLFPLEQ